jgi:hypothetical protein
MRDLLFSFVSKKFCSGFRNLAEAFLSGGSAVSWRAKGRMGVLFVMLGLVFATQARALDAMRASWCATLDCGCAATQDGQVLVTAACGCDSHGSWRTCTYG